MKCFTHACTTNKLKINYFNSILKFFTSFEFPLTKQCGIHGSFNSEIVEEYDPTLPLIYLNIFKDKKINFFFNKLYITKLAIFNNTYMMLYHH